MHVLSLRDGRHTDHFGQQVVAFYWDMPIEATTQDSTTRQLGQAGRLRKADASGFSSAQSKCAGQHALLCFNLDDAKRAMRLRRLENIGIPSRKASRRAPHGGRVVIRGRERMRKPNSLLRGLLN